MHIPWEGLSQWIFGDTPAKINTLDFSELHRIATRPTCAGSRLPFWQGQKDFHSHQANVPHRVQIPVQIVRD